MPKFKHPCFVRVEDAAEKKGLIEWLMAIGYSDISSVDGSVIMTQATDNKPEYLQEYIKIAANCGTSIDLFKAIAAINDDNDYMQWFTDGNKWFVCTHGDMKMVYCMGDSPFSSQNYHKATLAELIDKFKD